MEIRGPQVYPLAEHRPPARRLPKAPPQRPSAPQGSSTGNNNRFKVDEKTQADLLSQLFNFSRLEATLPTRSQLMAEKDIGSYANLYRIRFIFSDSTAEDFLSSQMQVAS
jgi:hypothetical protein